MDVSTGETDQGHALKVLVPFLNFLYFFQFNDSMFYLAKSKTSL